MKKLVASLSDRAKKEGRVGVTAIVEWAISFYLEGMAQSYRADKL
jgi:hypothetical protein